MDKLDPNTLIDRFGGTKAAAAIFGVVPSAVSNWRKHGIPRRVHSQVLIEAKARGIRITAAQLLEQATPPAAPAPQPGAEAA